MIQLGLKARVKGTNREGIVNGRAVFLYGADQYLIELGATSNGTPINQEWVVEGLLEVIGDGLKGKKFAVPGMSDDDNKRANEMVGT